MFEPKDDYKKAYAELDYIISNLESDYSEKIPQKLKDFFTESKDENYVVQYDPNIPLYQHDFEDYTWDVLNLINFKYWCTDNDEKSRLGKIVDQSMDNMSGESLKNFKNLDM